MDYIASIYNLSAKFYADYPHTEYPEILTKAGRPYSCLLVEYMADIFICIPFRTNVRHKYAYHFKNSARSRNSHSGLDYTKAVLIKNAYYLDLDACSVVDQDEYKEAITNLPRITKEVFSYIYDYRDHLLGLTPLHPSEWKRRYGMSTLPYFDTLLKECEVHTKTAPEP